MEPGIYIPNPVGVQVEENVAVTEDGVDVLNSPHRSNKDLTGVQQAVRSLCAQPATISRPHSCRHLRCLGVM
jgi:hypothetical protein